MLEDVKKKEQELKQQIIDAYKTEINKINEDLKAIDEKYLKKIEKEKKSLKESLEECNKALKAYGVEIPTESLITNIDAAVESVKEVKEAAETEEKVIDTLFDENNIEEEVSEQETEEQFPEEPSEQELDSQKEFEETKEADDDEWPEVPEEW